MRRRDLAIGLALAVVVRSSQAQDSSRTFRLGISAGAGTSRQQPSWLGFFEELEKAGLVEGKNLIVDWRLVESRPDEIAASVAEQVQWAPDALVTGPLAVAAVQAATRTIPILCVSDDMVANGLVPSLARPGGNLTGISILASELDGKRQELLMELVPASRHMGALADLTTKALPEIESLRSNTAARGVELSIYPVRSAEDIAPAIDAAQAADATALNVLAGPILYINRKIILSRSEALHLPTIYQWPETAEEGASPPTVRALARSTDSLPASSSRYCAALSPPICRSSSRPHSSRWSI